MIEINGKRHICDECQMIRGLDYQNELAEKYGIEFRIECYGRNNLGNEKVYACGFCPDIFDSGNKFRKSGSRKTGRVYRRNQKKKKDKRLRNIISYSGYKPMIGYIEHGLVDGIVQEIGDHIKYPRNSNRQRYLKRQSNKKVRRYRGKILKGSFYRKLFDYWWELY